MRSEQQRSRARRCRVCVCVCARVRACACVYASTCLYLPPTHQPTHARTYTHISPHTYKHAPITQILGENSWKTVGRGGGTTAAGLGGVEKGVVGGVSSGVTEDKDRGNAARQTVFSACRRGIIAYKQGSMVNTKSPTLNSQIVRRRSQLGPFFAIRVLREHRSWQGYNPNKSAFRCVCVCVCVC